MRLKSGLGDLNMVGKIWKGRNLLLNNWEEYQYVSKRSAIVLVSL